MKIIDEREMQKKKKKKTMTEKNKGAEAVVKGCELNDIVVRLSFGLLQLTSKATLILKSSLELTLSIILKKGELYASKHVAVECRCLKI